MKIAFCLLERKEPRAGKLRYSVQPSAGRVISRAVRE